ncbi:MAG: cytochrome c-type biogenesis protein CcmH [Betaproteobacteria bacterium]|nr:cytochrome c-type biogenesis protein CcmH [Betaproteobacteria bacterium]
MISSFFAPLITGVARSAAGFCLLATLALHALADDASLERRALALERELRCLVCQNQTLAESNAPLALDLRGQIREQLAAGKSEREITDYMVARYGDFVLYRPPLKSTTVLLWVGPFAFLLGGFYLLARVLRRRRIGAPQLSDADRSRAAKLLE